MKTVKTKLLAMLMAAVMVFAMAPLATGIAFADEEDVDAVEVTDVVDDTEEAEPQLEAAEAVDKGDLVIDLSNGPVTYPFNPSEGIISEEINMIMLAAQPNPFCDPWITLLMSYDQTSVAYLDLDDDGAMDVALNIVRPDDQSSATGYKLEATSYRSVQTSITIKMPPEIIEYFKTASSDSQYYSSMTFVLGKETAKVKAANTLAVKGKTAKIKYKKLKKKNQTLKLSKVITLTNAGQGAVTYAKAKGNKKIKVAKNGKVTVKKKLKKGTYKVTVNVTAAGNDAYDGITKKVTFKVKVK